MINFRVQLATACLLEANGSSYKYVNNKVAELVEDKDEDMDIIIKSGQLKNFRRIVSKCVNEFMNNETVSKYKTNLIKTNIEYL